MFTFFIMVWDIAISMTSLYELVGRGSNSGGGGFSALVQTGFVAYQPLKQWAESHSRVKRPGVVLTTHPISRRI